jgi:ABC-type uncharacterized transport system ATPase subunit
LNVRAGEIVGVAGVQGNGQTELVEVITGLRQPTGGHMTHQRAGNDQRQPAPDYRRGAEQPRPRRSPHLRHGRTVYSVAENLVLNTYYQKPFANGVVINEELPSKPMPKRWSPSLMCARPASNRTAAITLRRQPAEDGGGARV